MVLGCRARCTNLHAGHLSLGAIEDFPGTSPIQRVILRDRANKNNHRWRNGLKAAMTRLSPKS